MVGENSPSCFKQKLSLLVEQHEGLLARRNEVSVVWYNGLLDRYRYPVLTRQHTPLLWRYDLNEVTNPYLMERLGVNAVFNPGAILLGNTVYLVCRVEGVDRKSFFAVAESETGIDGFRFWSHPLEIPNGDASETNLYDMRLVQHEDGWIYGIFCTESHDPSATDGLAAVAQCGIARTRDLRDWERLPNLQTRSPQQRNVVLHPRFVDGKYAFYTRPQDNFIQLGNQIGIGWGYCAAIENPVLENERVVESVAYHTVKELKNGAGPKPIETKAGWLHIAHGVRGTASGLRYVLYAFLCDLEQPFRVTHRPGGYLMAPWGSERVGDVSNVLFCNGAIARPDGTLLVYYASSDTRIHVAATTIDQLLDYVLHTPEDGGTSHASVKERRRLIDQNMDYARMARSELLDRVISHVTPGNLDQDHTAVPS